MFEKQFAGNEYAMRVKLWFKIMATVFAYIMAALVCCGCSDSSARSTQTGDVDETENYEQDDDVEKPECGLFAFYDERKSACACMDGYYGDPTATCVRACLPFGYQTKGALNGTAAKIGIASGKIVFILGNKLYVYGSDGTREMAYSLPFSDREFLTDLDVIVTGEDATLQIHKLDKNGLAQKLGELDMTELYWNASRGFSAYRNTIYLTSDFYTNHRDSYPDMKKAVYWYIVDLSDAFCPKIVGVEDILKDSYGVYCIMSFNFRFGVDNGSAVYFTEYYERCNDGQAITFTTYSLDAPESPAPIAEAYKYQECCIWPKVAFSFSNSKLLVFPSKGSAYHYNPDAAALIDISDPSSPKLIEEKLPMTTEKFTNIVTYSKGVLIFDSDVLRIYNEFGFAKDSPLRYATVPKPSGASTPELWTSANDKFYVAWDDGSLSVETFPICNKKRRPFGRLLRN